MKYLLILGIIVLVVFLIANKIKNKIENVVQSFTTPPESKEKEDVIYQKDDIVVLKGEAGKDK